jgi:protein-tyrosine phosphatase
MSYSVLFICRQNRFRSPMAAALLHVFLRDNSCDKEWRVDSAGTWTQEGQPAVTGVVVEMASRGYNMSNHRTRQVTRTLLADYQLVLIMEQTLLEALRLEFPEMSGRMFLFSSMVGDAFDITDLDGANMVPPKLVADEINRLIGRGFDQIKTLADENNRASGSNQ